MGSFSADVAGLIRSLHVCVLTRRKKFDVSNTYPPESQADFFQLPWFRRGIGLRQKRRLQRRSQQGRQEDFSCLSTCFVGPARLLARGQGRGAFYPQASLEHRNSKGRAPLRRMPGFCLQRRVRIASSSAFSCSPERRGSLNTCADPSHFALRCSRFFLFKKNFTSLS